MRRVFAGATWGFAASYALCLPMTFGCLCLIVAIGAGIYVCRTPDKREVKPRVGY